MELKALLKGFFPNIKSLNIVNMQLISPNKNNPQPIMSTRGHELTVVLHKSIYIQVPHKGKTRVIKVQWEWKQKCGLA